MVLRGTSLSCASASASASAAVAFCFVSACGSFGSSGGDAPADAAVLLDAGSPDAVAADARVDGAVAPACGAGHTFCADFEGGPSAEWTGSFVLGGGALALTAGATGGFALLSTVSARSGGEGSAYVFQEFAGAKGLRVDLDVNIADVQLGSGGEFNILQISGVKGEASAILLFRNASPTFGLFVDMGNGTTTGSQALVDLQRDSWVHMQVVMQFGPTGHLLVRAGNQTAWDAEVASTQPAVPSLRIGIGRYLAPTPDLSGRFDNVRVDVLP
jgi:hypothetical protein